MVSITDNIDATVTCSSPSTSLTWYGWCTNVISSSTTTTVSSNDDIYRMWVNGLVVTHSKRSQEELDRLAKAQLEQEERYKQERLKREEERRLSQERATLLLIQHLNKKQKKAY